MVALVAQPEVVQLRSVLRHIEDVYNNCEILGSKLIDRGEFGLGKDLIANGRIHDNSKLHGIEWESLTTPSDKLFKEALAHHHKCNPHHPEHWDYHEIGTWRPYNNGIHEMSRVLIAELVCDWSARASEFGTSLHEWAFGKAMDRYNYSEHDSVYDMIKEFMDLLLERPFS